MAAVAKFHIKFSGGAGEGAAKEAESVFMVLPKKLNPC